MTSFNHQITLAKLDVECFTKDNPALVTLVNHAPPRTSSPDSLSNYSPLENDDSNYSFDSRIFTFSEDDKPPTKHKANNSCNSSNKSEPEKYLDLKKNQPLVLRFSSDRDTRLASTSSSSIPLVYQYKKRVAQGAYGQVIWYQTTNLKLAKKMEVPIDLCLKIGLKLGDLDADMEILSTFKNDTPDFIIPTRAVYVKLDDDDNDEIQPILIMPKMDGTIKQLINQLTFHDIYDKYWLVSAIIYSINMAFYQLVKKEVYYTDIKISNILYQLKPEKNGQTVLTICLGDLGSAFLAGDREAISTFPNTNRSRCHHFTPISYDLVYGLMIIFFEIMATGSKEGLLTHENEGTLDRELFQHLFHENIKELTIEQRHTIIQQIFSNLEELPIGNHITSDMSKSNGTGNDLIEKFLKTIKDKCYTNANKKKTADTQKILKSLLPIWQLFYQKFSQESNLANNISIRLGS